MVFIDEAGFMLQPFRRRTWAPRGKTPVQVVSAKHNRRVSAIAGLTWSCKRRRSRLYFQLTPDSIKTKQVIEFLRQLHRQLRRRVIVVLDRLNAHRSAVSWFAKNRPDWFQFEWLPPYAPELNPVEQCWSHTKCHELANFGPENIGALETAVRQRLTLKSRRQDLLQSWFTHAGLAV